MTSASPPSPNSHKQLITAAYYISFITLGLTFGAIGPVLPVLAKHTSTALSGISLIFIANSLGYMAGTWLGGRAYDRFPGHVLMAVALILASVMLFSLPITSVLWLLAGVIAVLGFFQGSLDVGVNTLLIWEHGSQVGPFMNGLHFSFGFGALIAPIVVAHLTGINGDIHWVYWLFAIVNIPIAVWVLLLPSPEMRLKVTAADEPKIHASPLILGSLLAFFFFYVGLESGYGDWIFTYATTLKLADATRAAYLSSTFWGAFTLFRLIAVWVSTRVSSQKILYGDFAGAAIGLGLILLLPASQPVLWIGTIILGASIASIFPTMLTLAEQRLHLTGSITRWCFVGGGLGHMILPWLIGQIFVPLGAPSMMAFIMVDLILNALTLGLVVVKSRNTRDVAKN